MDKKSKEAYLVPVAREISDNDIPDLQLYVHIEDGKIHDGNYNTPKEWPESYKNGYYTR